MTAEGPDVPEFIPPDLQADYASEAHEIVRGRDRPGETAPAASDADAGETAADSQPGRTPKANTLDNIHTVLAGLSIALVAVAAAIGIISIWVWIPWLAFVMAAGATATGLGWLVYHALLRRS